MQWAGATAFYLILSVPPLLIAAFSVGVVVVGPDVAREYITQQITQFLPAEQDVVTDIVSQTIEGRGPAAAISLAFLIFSGSRVFATLIAAINVMWAELPEPGFVRRQVTRIVMVFTVGGLLALAAALDLAVAFIGDDALPAPALALLQSQVLPALLAAAALFLLFRLIPRQAATWQTALAGALVGMLLLRIAQAAFTTDLNFGGGFESAYGPIAQAAVLFTWALVASGAVLLAAHLVAVLNDADARQPDGGGHKAPGETQARASRDGQEG